MLLNVEQTIIDYLNKYGFLFENDALILLEDIKNQNQIQRIKDLYKKKRQEIKDKKDSEIQSIKDFATSVAKDYSDELDLNKIVKKKKEQVIKLFVTRNNLLKKEAIRRIKIINQSGKVISGLSLASIIIYGSIQIYKEELKKMENLCSNKIGKERKKCMLKKKIKLAKNRISFLNTAKFKCKDSKDPVSCKSKLDQEKLKIHEKIKDYFRQLREDMGMEW